MVLPALLQVEELAPAVSVRWDVVVTGLALLAVYLVFRHRSEVTQAMGFSQAEVALLTLGPVAGQVASLPLFPVGQSLFAVNVGGVLVPLLLVGRLLHRGTLALVPLLVATVGVATVTRLVVQVDPTQGAVVPFPWFLVPPVVALVLGLILGLARPERAGPLALAGGSLGALVGADLLLLPRFVELAREAPAGSAFIMGGAGVLDLVFLSGAVGLALSLLLALAARDGRQPPVGDLEAPARRLEDPQAIVHAADHLGGLSPREACTVHLARAEQALAGDQTPRATGEARRAVAVLLEAGQPAVRARLDPAGPVQAAWRELEARARRAAGKAPDWAEAADSLELAKQVAGWLWSAAPGEHRLSEVAR